MFDEMMNPGVELNEQQKKALFNRSMMGLAQGLLAASAPSPVPISMGQAFGQGLSGAMSQYDTGLQDMMKAQYLQQQMQSQRMEIEAKKAALDMAKARSAQWGNLFKTPVPTDGRPSVANANMRAPIFSLVPGITPEQATVLQGIGPEKGWEAITKRTLPEGKIETIYDPKTGRNVKALIEGNTITVLGGVEAPNMGPGYEWNGTGAVSLPGFDEANARRVGMEAAARFPYQRAAVTNINMGTKELEKLDAQTIDEHTKRFVQLRGMMPDIQRAKTAIAQFPTGFAGETRLGAMQLGQMLGLNFGDKVSEGEMLQQIQSKLAPLMRPPGSGATSNFEVEIYMKALPNLMRTREGNLKVIDMMEKVVERAGKEDAYLRRHFRANNSSLDGAWQAMDKELGPVFNDQERIMLESAAGMNAMALPTATPQAALQTVVSQDGRSISGPMPRSGMPTREQVEAELRRRLQGAR